MADVLFWGKGKALETASTEAEEGAVFTQQTVVGEEVELRANRLSCSGW